MLRANHLIGVLMLAVLVAVASTAAFARPQENTTRAKKFEVGLIGDFPYAPEQQTEAQNLFDELNGERLAFVTHDGDIKSGSTACTDDVYEREYRRFEASENPFVYTPGDNEWTDCHRLPNPSPEEADPLNRLALLRRTFFSDGYSLGRKEIPLQRQSEAYPENARWRYGGVTFATLHVVGSNNNRPTTATPTIGNEEEWRARNSANIAWLKKTFGAAERQDSTAVMLVIQANIFEEDTQEPSGFAEFRDTLRRESIAFGKPVVLVHGDSHYFRIDKPLYAEEGDEGSRILNFTRVETFGDQDVHWVRATVDTRDPEVFSFQPEIVEENVTP
ncbi:MAG: hypothetical protein H0U55_01380 [Rubrobacteraceae bacterium]|nr:hypothetical protein [Rubrobacteraceae bacterium]